ncbi:hypothetical protein Tco_1401839 [Tanacetum coccineum]
MGNEELSTILEKESDEFIKSSVEDLVPIPSESEDTSESDSDCDLPSCDDFSPINVYEEKSVTFSNPLFDSNDDFTSSDDESLSDEDVPEDNVKIYSNPLFEFDDEYISSAVNPLFDEVLENIESKDSYVSNFDEPALLITPLSNFNEDEYFDPGGDIDEIEFISRYFALVFAILSLDHFVEIPSGESKVQMIENEAKNEDFRLRFEDVYAFFEIKTKSLIFPEYAIGKSMKIRSDSKRIENGAKTGITGLDLIKFNYYSKSRKSHEKSTNMPLERARENESNSALESYWAIP